MHARALGRVIDAVYVAAEDQRAWPAALQLIGKALHAPVVGLHVQTRGAAPAGHVQCAVGVDAQLQAEYDEYYGTRNVWVNRGGALLRERAVVTGEMICTSLEVDRSEYYTDYLRRFDVFHSLAAIPLCQRDGTVILTGLRSRAAGPFGPADVTLVSRLVPHLRRAARLHSHLQALQQEQGAMAQALDCVPFGVVLFSAVDDVTHANTAAGRLLGAAGCKLTPAGVRAPRSDDTQRLRRAVHDALTHTGDHGGTLRMPRTGSALSPLHVLVVPLNVDRAVSVPCCGVGAAMFITDPEDGPRVDQRVLRELFALTPTEASVLARLVSRETVGEIALRRHASQDTIRWVVKQILRKTDSQNQAQAIGKAMASLAVAVAPPADGRRQR